MAARLRALKGRVIVSLDDRPEILVDEPDLDAVCGPDVLRIHHFAGFSYSLPRPRIRIEGLHEPEHQRRA